MSKNGTINPPSSHNVIAVGTKLTGHIGADEDLRIDGIIEGNVHCKGKIIIGPTSVVTGDIECVSLDLMGKVNGNVKCSEKMFFRNSSQLVGDIKTQLIEIEPGAKFVGACSMNITAEK